MSGTEQNVVRVTPHFIHGTDLRVIFVTILLRPSGVKQAAQSHTAGSQSIKCPAPASVLIDPLTTPE